MRWTSEELAAKCRKSAREGAALALEGAAIEAARAALAVRVLHFERRRRKLEALRRAIGEQLQAAGAAEHEVLA